MNKNKKNQLSDNDRNELRAKILDFFNNANNIPYNYKQVSAAIGADSPIRRTEVTIILDQLDTEGVLVETSPGKYKATSRNTVAEGIFVQSSGSRCYVELPGEEDKPIHVTESNSMHALNGDRVRVHICARRKGQEAEAEVVEIIDRADHTFVGTLRVDKSFAYLDVTGKALDADIYIPKDKLKKGKNGDKAVVRLTNWPLNSKNPIGEVVDILGPTGENNAEIHAILAEYGLPYKYPENVVKAANKISDDLTEEEFAQRRDFRNITTFTIDPADAKDFDDALSINRLDNGHWQVGVHIADVTHYVTPGSIIDREGKERATSVYLVDRTIPMLPERLSNFICSLRPDETKLTYSCIIEMDDQAKIYNTDICRTVIRSNRRFTYEEAQEIIETGKGDFAQEILTLDRLAKILRKERFENGSVDFDRREVRFDIDESGRPLRVFFKESKDANKLIEEFMLLANKKVAERIGIAQPGKKAKAFVYRIHDMPNTDKLSDLASLARNFGHSLKTSGNSREVNKSLNNLLKQIKGRGEENLLSMLAVRSMAKAIYSTENIGHYGLAFDHYTHFTSPIRRYPDMMVHRLLTRYLSGGRSATAAKLEEDCKHSSDMEQLAASAERASIKYKQVEYMSERLGKVYQGIISGVTEWGLYVELDENMCEGLVPIRDLTGDYYEFDEKNYRLIGRSRNRIFQLGDRVTVQIARADLVKKQLDLALVDKDNPVGSHHIDSAPITYQSQNMSPQPSTGWSKKRNKGKKGKGGKKSSYRH